MCVYLRNVFHKILFLSEILYLIHCNLYFHFYSLVRKRLYSDPFEICWAEKKREKEEFTKGLLKAFFQDLNLHDFHFFLAWLVSSTVSHCVWQSPSRNDDKFDKVGTKCTN